MRRESLLKSSAGALIYELSILISAVALFLLASLPRLESAIGEALYSGSLALNGSYQVALFKPVDGGDKPTDPVAETEYQDSSTEAPRITEGGGSDTSMGPDVTNSPGLDVGDVVLRPDSAEEGPGNPPGVEAEGGSESESGSTRVYY